jgi:phosphatidylserine/phosphatidylglycerophosphate/cardiolipin synthase-like enzyme
MKGCMKLRYLQHVRNCAIFTFILSLNTGAFATTIEVGFSPNAGAEELILKAVGSARKTIRLAAYSFTSKPIVQALLRARKRGVDVQCTLDKSNLTNKSGRAGANILLNAGIAVRVDSMHAIHHNKYMVIDGHSVQTGSFNYSKAAAQSNAENAILISDDVRLATQFTEDWRSHWTHSTPWQSTY